MILIESRPYIESGTERRPCLCSSIHSDAEDQLDTRLKFRPSSGHKFSDIQPAQRKKYPEAKTAFKVLLAADPSSCEVDKRRFALPSSEEVAIIVDATDKKHDILLQLPSRTT